MDKNKPKGINMATADLETDIINAINASGLPLVNSKLVVASVLNQLNVNLNAEIAKEREEYSKKEGVK